MASRATSSAEVKIALAMLVLSSPTLITAPSLPPDVAIVSHHKSGTEAADQLLAAVCACTKYDDRGRLHRKRCPDRCRLHGVESFSDGAVPPDRLDQFQRVVHFTRNPWDMIMSGYLYHARGAETWARGPFEKRKRADIRYPAAEAFEEMLAGLDMVSRKALRYEAYLRNLGPSAGLRAESIRSTFASDGVGNMLAVSQHLALRKPTLSLEVCMHDYNPRGRTREQQLRVWSAIASFLPPGLLNMSRFKLKSATEVASTGHANSVQTSAELYAMANASIVASPRVRARWAQHMDRRTRAWASCKSEFETTKLAYLSQPASKAAQARARGGGGGG
jgi:hypothetical protein